MRVKEANFVWLREVSNALRAIVFILFGVMLLGRKVMATEPEYQIGEVALKANVPITIDGYVEDENHDINWYVDDVIVSSSDTYTPTEDNYEHWIKVEVTSEDSVVWQESRYFSKLPVIYINTDDGKPIISKNPYVTATMTMQGNNLIDEADYLYGSAGGNNVIQIKGRGNYSWGLPKKPYKIKLDKKANLLNLGAPNKHWVLLANYTDDSLLRNKLAYDLSEKIGLEVSMHSTWVSLIFNGEYTGVYQLCEHIRIADGRVEIHDWESDAEDAAESIAKEKYPDKKDKAIRKEFQSELEDYMVENLSWITTGEVSFNEVAYAIPGWTEPDISGGYLFESSSEYDEVSKFKTGTGLKVMVNTPEFLNSNTEMMNYVEKLWGDYEKAYRSEDGFIGDNHYSDFVDIDSMVCYWLAQELMGNPDVAVNSRYAYKEIGEKMKFGPVWDYDWAAFSSDSSRMWKGTNVQRDGCFFTEWVDDPVFLLMVRKRYWEKRDEFVQLFTDGGLIDQYTEYLKEAGLADEELWKYNRGFYNDLALLKNHLKDRCEWLDEQFATLDTLTGSLYCEDSAYPFIKSSDISVSTTSAIAKEYITPVLIDNMQADYYLPASTDLSLTLSTFDTASEIGICLDGKRYEYLPVTNGVTTITIPANKIRSAPDDLTLITMFAHDADGNSLGRNYFTVAIDDTLPIVTKPQAKSLKYTENAQALVEAGSVTNGNITYAITQIDEAPADSAFGSDVPLATNAGDYYVWFKVSGNGGSKDIDASSILVTIDPADAPSPGSISASQKPAVVPNLRYTGAQQNLITAPTTLPSAYNELWYSLDGSDYTKSIPQAQNVGTYVVTPKFVDSYHNTKDLILDSITVTISKASAPASIPADCKPTPLTGLIYTGQDITLINAPSSLPENYEKIYYSLSGDSWSEALPTALTVGTYVVKTKYTDTDGNYEDLFIEGITVSISKKTYDGDSPFPADRKPAAKSDLRYTGTPQALITPPVTPPDFYTVQYSLDGQNFSAELPLGSAVGTYTVNVKYVPTDTNNYEAFNGSPITVSIGKALAPSVDSLSADEIPALIDEANLVFTGEAITPITAPVKLPDIYTEVLYSIDGGNTLSTEIPTVVNAGTYVLKVKYIDGNGCHEDFFGRDISFVIRKAQGLVQKTAIVDISVGTENGLIDVSELLEDNYRIKEITVEGSLKGILTIIGSGPDEDGYLHYKLPKTEGNKETIILLDLESDNYADYSIAITVTTKAKITEGGLVVKGVRNMTYTGSALTQPQLQVYSGKTLLEEGTDYTLTYKNNTNAGTATVLVKGIGNYQGTQEDTFQILPVSIAGDNFAADDFYLVSTGKNQKKSPVLYKDGKTLAAQKNYSVGYYVEGTTVDTPNPQTTKSYSKSYVMILTGKGNYTGKRAVKVVIVPKGQTTLVSSLNVSLNKKSFTLLRDKNANGAVEPVVTVKKGKTVYQLGKDYTVSYQCNTSVGTGYVLVTGIGNFSGIKRIPFTINGTDISKAKVAGIKAKTFDPAYGSAYVQDAYTVTVNGKALVKGVDFTEKYTGNTKAGKASLEIKGIGDYSGTRNISFTIRKASLTSSDVKCEASVPYNKGGAIAPVTVTKNGVALTEGVDFTVTYKNNTKVTAAATAQAQVKGIGNYSGTVNLKFKVNPAVVTDQDGSLEMTAAGKSYTGDKKAKVTSLLSKPRLTDVVSSKALVSGTDYASAFKYEIAGSADGTFREITAADKSKKAGDFLNEVFGKDYNFSSKGVYIRVTATLKGNYSGSYSTVYRVAPALIISAKASVKAQDYTGKAVVFDPASKTFANDFKVYVGDNLKKGTVLVYGVDYEIVEGSYRNNVKKGSASVRIRGIGKYSGVKTIRFQIRARKL